MGVTDLEKVKLYVLHDKDPDPVHMNLVKHLTNDRMMFGVYITISKPYQKLMLKCKDNKIITKDLFIIDAITQMSGAPTSDENNCIFLDGPMNLTDMTIALRQAMEILKDKESFIYFDAMSTLLLYQQSNSILKFAHFLSQRIHEWNVLGLIITLPKECDDGFIKELSKYCDVKVDL